MMTKKRCFKNIESSDTFLVLEIFYGHESGSAFLWKVRSSVPDMKYINYARSNSIGEADKLKNEDQIIFRVFGIEEVGRNIKEDLTAVLQKKLDDKVRQ